VKRNSLGGLILALVSTLGLSYLPNANADVPTTFSFTGKGYGHGVGMSQIGARGLALGGDTATAIMNYYFPGSDVVALTDDQIIRVNIGHLLTNLKIKGDSPGMTWQIISGESIDSAIPLDLAAKDSVNFSISDKSILASVTKVGVKSDLPLSTSFTIRWSGTRYLAGPESIVSVTQNSKSSQYKYGQLQVKAIKDPKLGTKLELINSVKLHDEYLWGISEVPSSWPAAALEAQVIASRSFAMSKIGKIQKACDCEMYGSIADQNFAGYSKEAELKWGKFWRAAVNRTSITATTGLVVARNNLPLRTYFTSSTGGVTETSLNAWGTDVGYTYSVADPWSLDAKLNPNFVKWKRDVTQQVLAAAFLLPDVVSLKILALNQSGTVKFIEAKSSAGKKVKLTGEIFRSRTKIPSPWFALSSEDLVSVQN